MNLNISDVNTERKWKSLTGLKKTQFEQLLVLFQKSYTDLYKVSLEEKNKDAYNSFCLKNEKELLLFTLFSLKSGLTYDLQGLLMGMDASNAHRNQQIGVKVLAQALQGSGHMPARKLLNKKEFDQLLNGIDEILIDATEQLKQRPSDNEVQEKYYSGKKKPTQ